MLSFFSSPVDYMTRARFLHYTSLINLLGQLKFEIFKGDRSFSIEKSVARDLYTLYESELHYAFMIGEAVQVL